MYPCTFINANVLCICILPYVMPLLIFYYRCITLQDIQYGSVTISFFLPMSFYFYKVMGLSAIQHSVISLFTLKGLHYV